MKYFKSQVISFKDDTNIKFVIDRITSVNITCINLITTDKITVSIYYFETNVYIKKIEGQFTKGDIIKLRYNRYSSKGVFYEANKNYKILAVYSPPSRFHDNYIILVKHDKHGPVSAWADTFELVQSVRDRLEDYDYEIF